MQDFPLRKWPKHHMLLAFFQWFTPATKTIHARESCLNASAPFLMEESKKKKEKIDENNRQSK